MEEIPNPFGSAGHPDAARMPSPFEDQQQIMAFVLKYQARPVFVTPIIAAACVVMFVVVTIAGKDVMNPGGPVMVSHGANFGPRIVFQGEAWRLFTSTFLHFGLVHLALNLYCLSSSGPVLERFLGNASFAVLYVLAGLGGSIASLWMHPVGVVGAGASGAIFGIFGGLLGYLAVRRREVPTAILQPMRSGVLTFIVVNVALGFSNTFTDNAAHLGGLATGFVAGLLMTAFGSPEATGIIRFLGRTAAVAAVAAGLFGLEQKGVYVAREKIANHELGPIFPGEAETAPSYNSFIKAAQPVFIEFARIETSTDEILKAIGGRKETPGKLDATLQRLLVDSEALSKQIAALPAGNPEIGAMRDRLVTARDRQAHILETLQKFLQSGDPTIMNGPAGLQGQIHAYEKEFQDLNALRETYLKKYHLTLQKPVP